MLYEFDAVVCVFMGLDLSFALVVVFSLFFLFFFCETQKIRTMGQLLPEEISTDIYQNPFPFVGLVFCGKKIVTADSKRIVLILKRNVAHQWISVNN